VTPTLVEILALLNKEYGPVIAECVNLLFLRALLPPRMIPSLQSLAPAQTEIIVGWIWELKK